MPFSRYRAILLFISIFLSLAADAQHAASANVTDPSMQFYDVIEGDSVVMYFDEEFAFRGKDCAGNKRYTKVDQQGNFSGPYFDFDKIGRKKGSGNYIAGLRSGSFEIYYDQSDILRSKGSFVNDKPVGEWQYFYPNGKPERTLFFNGTDTLLQSFFDPNGKQTVKDGNGVFDGLVSASNQQIDKITATGNIVNGKADGKWVSYFMNAEYTIEYFDKGRFISGSFPRSLTPGKKSYTKFPLLDAFFLTLYFMRLEQFRVYECIKPVQVDYKTVVKNYRQEYKLDNLYSFANDAVSRTLELDAKNGTADYLPGENKCIIQFTVDKKGRANDFRKVTSWGDQFYNALTSVLSTHAKFPVPGETLYFIFTFNNRAGTTVGWRFNLSATIDR